MSDIPKIIHLSYKKLIPSEVLHLWKSLNPSYKIEFSLDKDCIAFMDKHFSKKLSTKFESIKRGAYKCDLWRLCKLYIEGGIYVDVDLVPHIPIDYIIKDKHSFYSCVSVDKKSIFQAFIATPPYNPIILACIISFMDNNPDTYMNGPTYDMYNVLQYIYNEPIISEKLYTIDNILIRINIGTSIIQTKEIDLYREMPEYDNIILEYNGTSDKFTFTISDNTLNVTRTDTNTGWNRNHHAFIKIKNKQSAYLFQEFGGYRDAHVKNKNIILFNSRNPSYINGW